MEVDGGMPIPANEESNTRADENEQMIMQ